MSSDNDTPEREKQVVELLRAAAAGERAPHTLHARVARMRDEAAARPSRRLRPRSVGVFARVAVPGAAAVAAAIVLAIGGSAGAPSLAQAAALGARGPTGSAPAPDPGAPAKLLSARVGDLHFPNWGADGGWRAVGQRHDHAGNRAVTTVYYAAGSTEIAYSIVSAPALADLHTNGEPYARLRLHGRTVIVWQERNHTCVLSAAGITAYELWRLASSPSA